MNEFAERTKHSLDECRTLILGTQVLAGFLSNAVFQKGFVALPYSSQILDLITLALMVCTFAFLMAPAFYHQLVEGGNDTIGLNRFATSMIEAALLPFAASLGMALFLVAATILSRGLALALSIAMTAIAITVWYGWEMTCGQKLKKEDLMKQTDSTPIKDKVDHVLTETRIIIPGAQALLGFQFIVFLSEVFKTLPRSLQCIHLACLLLVMISVVLLMTPAAYHREVERGKDSAHFHKVASRFVLIAPIPLALALSGELFVVASIVTRSGSIATIYAGTILIFTLTLWFVYPFLVRRRK